MSTISTNADSAPTRPASALIVLMLCWVAVVLDGFDLVVLGALIPTLTGGAEPWITPAEATFVSTISLVGMTLGALSIGVATDWLGRRKAMIFTVLIFSIMTFACGLAQSHVDLGIYRFLAGFGLGGCLPTAIAMVTEFSRGKAGTAATTLMTGYHVGAVATAFMALVLLKQFSWPSMFFAGAIPGFILVPLMIRYLPESPAFLTARNRRAEAEIIAQRYGITMLPEEASVEKASIRSLFRSPFLRNSVAIWVASFMGLVLVYGLNTWLPKLMVSAGYSLTGGLWLLLLLNAGAICGLLFAGRIGDRIGLNVAALTWFLVAAGLLALLSIRMDPVLLYPAVFLTGCFVFSASNERKLVMP